MKKTGFVVDKGTEDSFYENLFLGLSKVLKKSPCVLITSLKSVAGIRQMDIRTWEHNNAIFLPIDLRAFFSSTNGYLCTYNFSYDCTTSDESNEVIRQGKIEINRLSNVASIYGYETKVWSKFNKFGTNISFT